MATMKVWNGTGWDYLTGSHTHDNKATLDDYTGTPPVIVKFETSGTYTKSEGLSHIKVTVVGGGGGGGYLNCTADGARGAAGGGGNGQDAAKIIYDSDLPVETSVTIGAGGSGGIGSTSTNPTMGGETSFGTFVSALGGLAGGSGAITSSTGAGVFSRGGASARNATPTYVGDYFASGLGGRDGFVEGSGFPGSGAGGSSKLGRGGGKVTLTIVDGVENGQAGTLGGGGSGGSARRTSTTSQFANGGAGGDGIVIIEEYYK